MLTEQVERFLFGVVSFCFKKEKEDTGDTCSKRGHLSRRPFSNMKGVQLISCSSTMMMIKIIIAIIIIKNRTLAEKYKYIYLSL